MKKGIHPENYRLVAFKDMSNNDIFLAKSTAQTSETVTVDGVVSTSKVRNIENLSPLLYRES